MNLVSSRQLSFHYFHLVWQSIMIENLLGQIPINIIKTFLSILCHRCTESKKPCLVLIEIVGRIERFDNEFVRFFFFTVYEPNPKRKLKKVPSYVERTKHKFLFAHSSLWSSAREISNNSRRNNGDRRNVGREVNFFYPGYIITRYIYSVIFIVFNQFSNFSRKTRSLRACFFVYQLISEMLWKSLIMEMLLKSSVFLHTVVTTVVFF